MLFPKVLDCSTLIHITAFLHWCFGVVFAMDSFAYKDLLGVFVCLFWAWWRHVEYFTYCSAFDIEKQGCLPSVQKENWTTRTQPFYTMSLLDWLKRAHRLFGLLDDQAALGSRQSPGQEPQGQALATNLVCRNEVKPVVIFLVSFYVKSGHCMKCFFRLFQDEIITVSKYESSVTGNYYFLIKSFLFISLKLVHRHLN
jgi:hypothetical protein